MPLRLAELQVLAELVRERRATTTELARVMQRTDAETRNILARMVYAGKRRDRRESPPFSFRAEWKSKQEQMVLQYVDAHSQITRTEAADLCSLTPDQASPLLRRLAKEGKLKLRGELRGIGICQTSPMKPARKTAAAAWLNKTASPRRPFRYLT